MVQQESISYKVPFELKKSCFCVSHTKVRVVVGVRVELVGVVSVLHKEAIGNIIGNISLYVKEDSAKH